MVGILAYGAYVPQRRLQRAAIAKAHSWFTPGLKGLAKGERAIANWDEDTITMAVEAARDCLGDGAREEVAALTLASTTLPFADRQNAGIVKEALVLDDNVSALDAGGSLRAGTSALIHALAMAEGRSTLCVASDRRIGQPGSELEISGGDAAAALLLGANVGEVIAEFVGSHSVTVDFVDHFRATGARYDYGWESRWIRDEGYLGIMADAISAACKRLEIDPAGIAHAILPVSVKGVPESIAKRTGLRAEAVADLLIQDVGHSGAAHALLMMANCLDNAKPGELILLSGFGQGCDVLIFRATSKIGSARPQNGVGGWLARRQADDNYLRYLSFTGEINMERGMRAEADNKTQLTALYRNRKAVFGLVGGRCSKTGTIQFPPSDISVASNEKAYGTQEDYPLADKRARILSYTADLLAYSPSPPSCYGMVEFEGGGRMVAEFSDVPDLDAVAVGREMRMMFRIKAIDEPRDFKRYFWKAVPMELTPADTAQ